MAWPDGLFNGDPATTGVSVDALAGVYVTDLSGLLAPGVRDSPAGLKIPYADGDAAVTNRSFAPYQFEVSMIVLPEDISGVVPATSQGVRAQLLSNLAGIQSWLVNAGGAGTYYRRVSASSSTSANHSATLSYEGGLTAAMRPGAVRADLTLLFVNHTGYWLSGSTPVWP